MAEYDVPVFVEKICRHRCNSICHNPGAVQLGICCEKCKICDARIECSKKNWHLIECHNIQKN